MQSRSGSAPEKVETRKPHSAVFIRPKRVSFDGMHMSQYDGLILGLIEQVQQQANKPDEGYYYSSSIRPPLETEQIREAEGLLGFRLPLLMKRLYSEVADGFWGPGYGLPPLLTGISDIGVNSIVEDKIVKDELGWPSDLIFLCSWGCCFDAYVDYTNPDLPVIYEDEGPNGDYLRWSSGYSLDKFFQAWLDGSLSRRG